MTPRRADQPIVLAQGLGDRHRQLVALMRAAGPRGMTRRELRAALGNDWRGVLRDLQTNEYTFDALRSKIDDRVWRWVLRHEPDLVVVAATADEDTHLCAHCAGAGATRVTVCKSCGERVWLHQACRPLWLREACDGPTTPVAAPQLALTDQTRSS